MNSCLVVYYDVVVFNAEDAARVNSDSTAYSETAYNAGIIFSHDESYFSWSQSYQVVYSDFSNVISINKWTNGSNVDMNFDGYE